MSHPLRSRQEQSRRSEKSRTSLRRAITAPLLILCGNLLLLQPLAFTEEGQYMGVASCSSSNCHGANTPRKSTSVLQNEFSTWHKYGKHSKAWTVLLKDDAQKIGSHLGITKPEHDPLCLQCHATYVPEESKRGAKFTYEDGVTCETCHGAASGWITPHTKSGTTHEENIQNGLMDLSDLSVRTKLCLSCHYGTDDKTVNHRLIGAGHPRLTFELDTFSMIQPRHWEVDEDYKERKGDYIPAKAWLIGQTLLASERLKALASTVRSKNGIWPELSLFTCESCHHSLKEDRWKVRDFGDRAGELRLNLSSFMLLTSVLRELNADAASTIDALLETLHEKYKSGNAAEHIEQLQMLLQKNVLPMVTELTYSDALLTRLFTELVQFATRPHFQYEEAEQILMGLSSLVATSAALERRHKDSLEELYTALQDDEAYDADAFTKAASKLYRELL